MGPLSPVTKDGNRYVAIAVCAFSKFVEAQGKSIKINVIMKSFMSLQKRRQNFQRNIEFSGPKMTLILTDCSLKVVS